MRLLLALLFTVSFSFGQNADNVKTIHVFVALCDNINQGIVPVSKTLGNGQNPKSNLYWGALYGVKTHFRQSSDWTLVKTWQNPENNILERVLFKHNLQEVYMLADAYDGKYIKQTTIDFLEAAAGNNPIVMDWEGSQLNFGGEAGLTAYVGHDGLMEFDVAGNFVANSTVKTKDAIILACISKDYFSPYLQQTAANPLVWTTGLMAPEAYTLKAAITGWILNESDSQIRERAAQAYHAYQKCGIRGARGLLVTGY